MDTHLCSHLVAAVCNCFVIVTQTITASTYLFKWSHGGGRIHGHDLLQRHGGGLTCGQITCMWNGVHPLINPQHLPLICPRATVGWACGGGGPWRHQRVCKYNSGVGIGRAHTFTLGRVCSDAEADAEPNGKRYPNLPHAAFPPRLAPWAPRGHVLVLEKAQARRERKKVREANALQMWAAGDSQGISVGA